MVLKGSFARTGSQPGTMDGNAGLVIGGAVPLMLAFLIAAMALQRHASPALGWWAGALALETVRFFLHFTDPGALYGKGILVTQAVHFSFALLVLAGTASFLKLKDWPKFLGPLALIFFAGLGLRLAMPELERQIAFATSIFGIGLFALIPFIFLYSRRTELTTVVMIAMPFGGLGMVCFVNAFGLTPRSVTSQIGGLPIADAFFSIFAILALIIAMLRAQYKESLSARERVQSSERQLSASETRFQDIVEVASDWVWESDRDHRFTFFSQRFEEVTGFAAERFLGKTRAELDGANPQQVKQIGAFLEERAPSATRPTPLFRPMATNAS